MPAVNYAERSRPGLVTQRTRHRIVSAEETAVLLSNPSTPGIPDLDGDPADTMLSCSLRGRENRRAHGGLPIHRDVCDGLLVVAGRTEYNQSPAFVRLRRGRGLPSAEAAGDGGHETSATDAARNICFSRDTATCLCRGVH